MPRIIPSPVMYQGVLPWLSLVEKKGPITGTPCNHLTKSLETKPRATGPPILKACNTIRHICLNEGRIYNRFDDYTRNTAISAKVCVFTAFLMD